LPVPTGSGIAGRVSWTSDEDEPVLPRRRAGAVSSV